MGGGRATTSLHEPGGSGWGRKRNAGAAFRLRLNGRWKPRGSEEWRVTRKGKAKLMWLKNAVKNWAGRGRADAELDEEVRGYVEMSADEKVRNGVDARAAGREAVMEAGGVEQLKEQTREVRAGYLLETLWQDIRYGTRMLRKAP